MIHRTEFDTIEQRPLYCPGTLSTQSRSPILDARARRTFRKLLAAFSELVLGHRRYDEISVSDIIQRAGVARSTFYQHFANKDELLVSSMTPLLDVMAAAAVGDDVEGDMQVLLAHFWENRGAARLILRGEPLELIGRSLAARIEARWDDSVHRFGAGTPRLAAIYAAQGQLAVLRAWLAGRISAEVTALARFLIRSALPEDS